MSEQSNQTDTSLDELVLSARQGDDTAFARLAAAMLPAIRARAAAYACADLDAEDLVQEGLLALLSAVHTYQIGAEASFGTYAGVCIRNRMISVLRKVSGGKSVRSQDMVPLDADLPVSALTVEAYGDLREECETLLRRVDTKLSFNERTVLYLFLSGLSYREIAERLGKTPKSVDNALQRVRHKLKGDWA
ncbi:MAG: sigma-70 family RNA polymerase sigma factor [Candidatus Fimenecus sp.]